MARSRGRRPRPPSPHLVIDDWYVGCGRQRHRCDSSDVFTQLCSHFQPTVSRQGPEYGINQIPLLKEKIKPIFKYSYNNKDTFSNNNLEESGSQRPWLMDTRGTFLGPQETLTLCPGERTPPNGPLV